MTIDHYAPCPCGSGKKLKFCKCIDQPQDFEKILKLIEGDQHLAALDRINQMLEKTPNTAWLLAIKGELTLTMQEFESFIETANRFHKLKPDNPLGLLMKALANGIEQKPVESIARNILEGLSESRESVHELAITAIRMLMQAMAAEGKLCLVGFWSDIFSALSGEQPDNNSPSLDPQINLLAKTPVKLVDNPSGTAWAERLAEVVSLTKTFRFAQAETKLRSILRDFPDQAAPLSHLLRAQAALLDQSGAYQTALKLADHLDITPEERAYYRAVALEIEPQSKSIQAKMSIEYCEVDSEERIQEALSQFDFIVTPDDEALEEVRRYYAAIVEDEVPAKRIYSVFNIDMDKSPEGEQRVIGSSVGTVVLYGKQTDKPTRVLLIVNELGSYQEIIEKVRNALQLGTPIPDVEIPINNAYAEFLRRPHALAGQPAEQLTLEERGNELQQDFLNMPVAVLDGKSPLEAAGDERLRANLVALLYHLEGEQAIVVSSETIDSIYRSLELERPKITVDKNSDGIRLTTALDMDRVDVAELNDQQLKGLTIRAMGLGATRVFYHCAIAIRSRESCKDDVQLQVAVMSGLLSILPGLDERIALCEELEQVLAAAKSPVGRVVIQRMSMLQAAGRVEEARDTLRRGVEKYPDDPYLMSFVQYAMQAQQGGPGSDQLAMKMMQNASRTKQAAPESGLVLPSDAAPPSNSSEGGESKLWLPGS